MTVPLLDAGVLIPLVDLNHDLDPAARKWCVANHKQGWATCPLTATSTRAVAGDAAALRVIATA